MNAGAGPKRVSYIQRRDDIGEEEFHTHWSQKHSLIVRELPGVVQYVQNHVVDRIPLGDDLPRIDGMVELWFENDEVPAAGFASDVADRLEADERHFMQGLGGSAVIGDAPEAANTPAAAWLVADWADGPASGLTAAVAARTGRAVDSLSLNLAVPGAPVLRRPGLRVLPVAELALSIGCATVDAAWELVGAIADSDLSSLEVRNARLLVSRRVRIV